MSWHARALGAIFLITGGLVVSAGVPRGIASAWMAAGDPSFRALNEGKGYSEELLATAAEGRKKALAWYPSARAYTTLGALYTIQAYRTGALSPVAEGYLRQGLARRPLNATSWLALANQQFWFGSEEEKLDAVKAWRASVVASPHQWQLTHARLFVGIRLYQLMTPNEKVMLRQQVVNGYIYSRDWLKAFAVENGMIEWVRYLLRFDPEKQAYFW